MNISNPISNSIKRIEFSFYSSADLQKLSVKPITNPIIFDNLDHPTTGGLYDPALGPFDKSSSCATCSLDYRSCPGHFGHIDLSLPVYNPITFRRMFKMLQSVCHYCHNLRVSKIATRLYAAKFELVRAGLLVEAEEISDLVSVKPRKKEVDESGDFDIDLIGDEAEVEGVDGVDGVVKKIETYLKKALDRAAAAGGGKAKKVCIFKSVCLSL